MKKIIIITPFVFAFILVTGVLVYLNSIYNNIFHFDFSPKIDNQKTALLDSVSTKNSLNSNTDKYENDLASNEKNVNDTTNSQYNINSNEQPALNAINDNSSVSTEDKSTQKLVEKTNKDSAYNAWLKKTVKLVENLPPAQASKLLKNYSDNQARDIIYTMKQKQAAKIISYLEPEYVQKLTRFQ
jgi:flagellar motility protein MotE (MotC chaperone)